MCVPFGAGWQYVNLEQQNVLYGVTSIDGDCIALGVKKFNFNFNSETFQVCDESVDVLSIDKNPLFPYECIK